MIACVSPCLMVRSTPLRISRAPSPPSTVTCRSLISSVATVALLLDGDVDVVALDLHGIGGDGTVGRKAGGPAAAQVEPRPVQPALDGAVLDIAVRQVDVGMRADVRDRVDLALRPGDADRDAVDLETEGTVVGELAQRAGEPEVAALVGSGAHTAAPVSSRVRASSSSTRASRRCSTSGRPI